MFLLPPQKQTPSKCPNKKPVDQRIFMSSKTTWDVISNNYEPMTHPWDEKDYIGYTRTFAFCMANMSGNIHIVLVRWVRWDCVQTTPTTNRICFGASSSNNVTWPTSPWMFLKNSGWQPARMIYASIVTNIIYISYRLYIDIQPMTVI